jgi:hypothetical protein
VYKSSRFLRLVLSTFTLRFKLEYFLTLVIDLTDALDFTHVWWPNTLNEIKISQPVKTTSWTLVQHHLVFVHRGIAWHEEHNVSWVEFFACFAVEIAIDHACFVSDQTLNQDLFVLQLFWLVFGKDDNLQVEIFHLGPKLVQLVAGFFFEKFAKTWRHLNLLLLIHFEFIYIKVTINCSLLS